MRKLVAVILSLIAVVTAHAEQHTYTYRVRFKPVQAACWAAGWIYNGDGQYGIDPTLGFTYTVPSTGSMVLENSGNYDCCEYNHQRILMGNAWQEISTDGGAWQMVSPTYVSVYLPIGAMEGYYYVLPTNVLSAGSWLIGCPQ